MGTPQDFSDHVWPRRVHTAKTVKNIAFFNGFRGGKVHSRSTSWPLGATLCPPEAAFGNVRELLDARWKALGCTLDAFRGPGGFGRGHAITRGPGGDYKGGSGMVFGPQRRSQGAITGGGRVRFLGPGGDYRGGTSKPVLDNPMNGYLDIWRIG